MMRKEIDALQKICENRYSIEKYCNTNNLQYNELTDSIIEISFTDICNENNILIQLNDLFNPVDSWIGINKVFLKLQ